MRIRFLSVLALGAPLALSACGGFNQEAGAFLDGGTFGNATMNNHLVQTCADTTNTKYATGKCPPRTLDGKYANAVYGGYVESATEIPSITRTFGEAGSGADN
jgi:hypothetical protein